jgi:hypothetical protein
MALEIVPTIHSSYHHQVFFMNKDHAIIFMGDGTAYGEAILEKS